MKNIVFFNKVPIYTLQFTIHFVLLRLNVSGPLVETQNYHTQEQTATDGNVQHLVDIHIDIVRLSTCLVPIHPLALFCFTNNLSVIMKLGKSDTAIA